MSQGTVVKDAFDPGYYYSRKLLSTSIETGQSLSKSFTSKDPGVTYNKLFI